ncbi:hypothetical protein FZ058_06925 [Listeria monocytogenes]|nr:hypothetical protein FZ058_06925 [Listeria monocytogenes]
MFIIKKIKNALISSAFEYVIAQRFTKRSQKGCSCDAIIEEWKTTNNCMIIFNLKIGVTIDWKNLILTTMMLIIMQNF